MAVVRCHHLLFIKFFAISCHLLPLLCGLIVSEVLGSVSENTLSGKFSKVKCKKGDSSIAYAYATVSPKTANNCINHPFLCNCCPWKTKRIAHEHAIEKGCLKTMRHPLHIYSILSADYFQYSSCERYPSYCVRLSSSVRFSGLGMWLIRKSIRASFESYKYLPSL